ALVGVRVEVVAEVLGRDERHLAEGVADVLDGAVVPLGHRVHLGAVARGQHDDFADVFATRQIAQHLREARGRNVHPLEQFERDGAMVQSDDDDRHACRRSLASATWPFLISSSMSESRAFCQFSPSVERPSARTASRSAASRSTSTSYSGPISAARRFLSHDATAGLRPPVDTATVREPRRMIAGWVAEQWSGSSTLLTQTPAASPSSYTAAFVDGESVAATANRYPDTSPRLYERSSQVTGRARTSGPTCSATTWTSAPHARRAAAFWAATSP